MAKIPSFSRIIIISFTTLLVSLGAVGIQLTAAVAEKKVILATQTLDCVTGLTVDNHSADSAFSPCGLSPKTNKPLSKTEAREALTVAEAGERENTSWILGITALAGLVGLLLIVDPREQPDDSKPLLFDSSSKKLMGVLLNVFALTQTSMLLMMSF